MITAVKLYHKRKKEQIDDHDKVWAWAIKRWPFFPYLECEMRQ